MRAVRQSWICLVVMAGCLLWGAAWSASTDDLGTWTGGSEPVQIHSRELEARAADGVVVFRGDVVAQQGNLIVQADRMTATVDTEAQQIRTVEASGNVRIQREELVATGEKAEFDVGAGLLTLSGEAKAWQDRNVLGGERIILHLSDNRVEVKGGAKMFLVPQEPPTRP